MRERATCAHMLNNNILAWLISVAAAAVAAAAERRQLSQQRMTKNGRLFEALKVFLKTSSRERKITEMFDTQSAVEWECYSSTRRDMDTSVRYHITNMHARHQSTTKQKRVGICIASAVRRYVQSTRHAWQRLRKSHDVAEQKGV